MSFYSVIIKKKVKAESMKKFFLLIAFLTGAGARAQQVIYSNNFDGLPLQTYTTAGFTAQYTNVPAGLNIINDGLGNNTGSLNNPNNPFHEPSLKTTGWAVTYNPLENDTFLVSTSWLDTTGLNVDRWVITPLISNISANTVLTWLAKSPDGSYRDGYEVYGTTNTGVLTAQSFAIGDRLFALADGNTTNGGENSTWTRRSVSLAALNGLQLRFAFRNNSKDMYQLWIDDLQVLTLSNSLDGTLSNAPFNKYILTNTSDSVHVNFKSIGATAVNSLNVSYQIGNSSTNSENFTFTSPLNYGQSSLLKFAIPYSVSQPGYYAVKVWINSVNGVPDQNPANDTTRYYITVQGSAPAKAVLMEQFTSANSVTGPDAQDKVLALQSNSIIVVNIHHQDSIYAASSSSLIIDYKRDLGTALIDRFYFDDLGTTTLERTYYASRSSMRKSAVSPAAISIINKSYNATTRELSFTVKADFVGEVKGDYRLNAYLTENQVCGLVTDTTINGYNQWNGLYDVPWSYYYLMGYYAPLVNAYILNALQYKHHNTLVHAFDGSYGNAGLIPSTGGTQGQSYQKTFTLTLPNYTTGINKFKPDNLYLVGFLAEYNADKNQRTVLNAVKEKLTTNPESVGIGELAKNLTISVFPNPSRGELFIDSRLFETGYQLSLFNTLGQQLLIDRTKEGGSVERLDLSGFPTGIYFLKISSGKQHRTEKIVLQKN